LAIFLLFAVSRAFLRLKDGSLTFGSFLFWLAIWSLATLAIIDPSFTTYVASLIGIQRGTDVVTYLSIALLFYLLFRVNILIENLKDEITHLNRLIALLGRKETKKK
jgi:hypothetical protein